MTPSQLDAKYMHERRRAKIIRLRRNGYKLWRIARDVGVDERVVRIVVEMRKLNQGGN